MTRRFAAFLIVSALVLPALGQNAPTPEERIEQLEEENQRLRQELADLRMELAQLRRRMAEDAPDDSPEDAPEEAPADDGDGPDAEVEAQRTYNSADQIFRAIPEDLNPSRDGWDVVKRVAVEQWIEGNIPGSRFEARLEVSRVAIRYVEQRDEWVVTVHFAHREMRFMNWDIEERINPVSLTGDSDFADNARRLEAGTRVNVSATLGVTGWGTVIGQAADANWKPNRYTLNLQDATIRSPHLRRQ